MIMDEGPLQSKLDISVLPSFFHLCIFLHNLHIKYLTKFWMYKVSKCEINYLSGQFCEICVLLHFSFTKYTFKHKGAFKNYAHNILTFITTFLPLVDIFKWFVFTFMKKSLHIIDILPTNQLCTSSCQRIFEWPLICKLFLVGEVPN